MAGFPHKSGGHINMMFSVIPTVQTIIESRPTGKINNMFLREESSWDLNPATEQEDSIQLDFGYLLNLLIDHHLNYCTLSCHNPLTAT